MKKAPQNVVELKRERREKEVNVGTLWRKLKARWRKSKQKGSKSTDATHKGIEYFILLPKANSALYLRPGEVVAMKHNREWTRAKLKEVDGY